MVRHADTDPRDPAAVAACFTEDGTVLDEGKLHHGRDEIRAWREDLIGQFTYTTAVTGSEPGGDGEYRVRALVEGEFPGGTADLAYVFTLSGDLIPALRIDG